jgi:hypothetical protein
MAPSTSLGKFEMANEMSWGTGTRPGMSRVMTVAGKSTEIPATGAAVGEMYYSTDTGEIKTWDGTKWVTMATGSGGGGGGVGILDQGFLTDKILDTLQRFVNAELQESPEHQLKVLKGIKERLKNVDPLTLHSKADTQVWYFDRLAKAALLDDRESFEAILQEMYDPILLRVQSLRPLILVRHDL